MSNLVVGASRSDVRVPLQIRTEHRTCVMLSSFKTSFTWQFAGGFVLGALGLFALQPAEATRTFASHFVPVAIVR
jgi:hypothetical protein